LDVAGPLEIIWNFSTCGDGFKTGFEECDDGNTDDLDGCSSICKHELGYFCDGGSPTTPDTCYYCPEGSDNCFPKTAKKLHRELKRTLQGSVCGDGQKTDDEECDDGNTYPGDGCGPDCFIEPNWYCSGGTPLTPDICKPLCGDGILTGWETCEDGNTASGDGCSSDCVIEPGWKCEGLPAICTTICGDGIVVGDEVCDAVTPDGGCLPDCSGPEQGFYC
jgi:cysteine-rich repeat protein